MKLFGAIEAGGTKFVCAIGRQDGVLLDRIRFPTNRPDETLDRCLEYFARMREKYRLEAVGIASFGPVDLDPDSPTYGQITATPKPGWSGTDIVGRFAKGTGLPIGFDTDVNAAAQAEHNWGSSRGLHTFIYLTVGTGIGGGALVNGQRLHGLLHPEMGHIAVNHDWSVDPFEGICPFHGDCLEGLANGPALRKRWNTDPAELADNHPAWDLEARYLAQALVSYIYVLSPQMIILGGGVMQRPQLFPQIRKEVQRLLAGYLKAPLLESRIQDYIVPPELHPDSGVLGGIALAVEAAQSKESQAAEV